MQEPGNLFLIPGISPCVGSHRVALLQNVPVKLTWMVINPLLETKSPRLLSKEMISDIGDDKGVLSCNRFFEVGLS